MIGRLSTSLFLALLALAFGAAPNSASAAPPDSSGGGAGGTAAASSSEGDTATAVDGNEGTDGTAVQLPSGLSGLFESDAEAEEEDPNAHVDRSGATGQSVTVIGTEESRTQRVTVQGENGPNGMSTQEVSQEVGSTGEGIVLPSADELTDAMPILQ